MLRNLLTSRTVNCMPSPPSSGNRSASTTRTRDLATPQPDSGRDGPAPRPLTGAGSPGAASSCSARPICRRISTRDSCSIDRMAYARIAQHERQLGHQVQMGPRGRADDREQRVHRLAVQGAVLDRPLQEAERERRPPHVQHDRVAHVRDRDPVADGRGRDGLPGEKNPEQELPVHLVRQAEQLHDLAQRALLVLAGDAIEDPAGFQRVEERRHGLPLRLRLREDLTRDVQPAGRRPFQDLRPVEAVLVLDPVSRDGLLLDPAIDRLLGDLQQAGGVADG